ncbi:MAG: hypothetical protein LBQ39_04735 [Tannerellaceae bacterium]|jgi:hypothetical protein|nr:hypothetical protein [Tannerellaceae bacterium]
MSICNCAKKERKWAIKNVDLTKSYVSLTNAGDFSASLLEMMLMFSGKHALFFGKTSASFPEKTLMFLVNECKSTPKTGIILYKTPIFGLFYAHFENVKDSEIPLLLDK